MVRLGCQSRLLREMLRQAGNGTGAVPRPRPRAPLRPSAHSEADPGRRAGAWLPQRPLLLRCAPVAARVQVPSRRGALPLADALLRRRLVPPLPSPLRARCVVAGVIQGLVVFPPRAWRLSSRLETAHILEGSASERGGLAAARLQSGYMPPPLPSLFGQKKERYSSPCTLVS